MFITRLMEKPSTTNDNEQLASSPWQLHFQDASDRSRTDDKKDQPTTRETEEEKAETHRRYVEQRLRETLMWERASANQRSEFAGPCPSAEQIPGHSIPRATGRFSII